MFLMLKSCAFSIATFHFWNPELKKFPVEFEFQFSNMLNWIFQLKKFQLTETTWSCTRWWNQSKVKRIFFIWNLMFFSFINRMKIRDSQWDRRFKVCRNPSNLQVNEFKWKFNNFSTPSISCHFVIAKKYEISLTGRFQGKQSRSFPELSETSKEHAPVRQLSDGQQSDSKSNQSKLPVASSRFPAVETKDEGSIASSSGFKNPYSFNQDYKPKYPQKFGTESNGEKICDKVEIDLIRIFIFLVSPRHQSSHLDPKAKRQFSTSDTTSSRSTSRQKQSNTKSSPKKTR